MRFLRRVVFFGFVAPAVCLYSIDASVELSLARNSIRTHSLGSNSVPVMVSTNLFQLNAAATVSQNFGDALTVGGSFAGLSVFRRENVREYDEGPLDNRVMLVPQEIDFQVLATYAFSDIFSAGLAYNLYSSVILESEPSFLLTATAPIDLDWFSLSGQMALNYCFSVYGNGFGATASVQPLFTVPDWALSLGFPVGLSFATDGYKNSGMTGLDSVSFAVTVQWMMVRGLALTGSFGYAPGLMPEPGESFTWGEPYFQFGIVFLVLS